MQERRERFREERSDTIRVYFKVGGLCDKAVSKKATHKRDRSARAREKGKKNIKEVEENVKEKRDSEKKEQKIVILFGYTSG